MNAGRPSDRAVLREPEAAGHERMPIAELIDLVNSFREVYCMDGDAALNECLRLVEIELSERAS